MLPRGRGGSESLVTRRFESETGERGALRELRRHQSVERLGRIGHWYLPGGSRTVRWSREAARIHGLATAPSKVPLDMLLGTLSVPAGDRLFAALTDAAAVGRGFDFEAVLPVGSGERTLRMVGECERRSGAVPIGVLVVVQDISEHRSALAALAWAEARTADFLNIASDWLWEMDADLRFTYVSPQVGCMGVPAAAHIGRTRRDLLAEEEVTSDVVEHLGTLARREPFRDFCYWRTGRDGIRRCISTSGKPLFDEAGRFVGYRGSARDATSEHAAREQLVEANRQLTAEKRRADEALDSLRQVNARLSESNAQMARAQSEIRRGALYDALTGLANRRHLDERLDGYARRNARTGAMIGLLHIDLDRFKQVNETLGHAAGDAVLRHVASTLQRRSLPGDMAARVGGDEFVLVCASCKDERALETMARLLIDEFERPCLHDGRECWFGALSQHLRFLSCLALAGRKQH